VEEVDEGIVLGGVLFHSFWTMRGRGRRMQEEDGVCFLCCGD